MKGYAFVSFDSGALAKGSVDVVGVEAALRVCTDLRNKVVDNVRYRCELGNRLQKQAASMSLAPALVPAGVPCAPLGGYYSPNGEYAPVPSAMYASPGTQAPLSTQPLMQTQMQSQMQNQGQGHLQGSYSQHISSASTDGSGLVYSPPMLMSPYSSNPSTPTNYQLRMAQLAQQQQQLHMSYQQQLQQQQQVQQQQQYRAPHPGYTPVPTPTNLNNPQAPADTALQVLQQSQGPPPNTPAQQLTKHAQDPQHPHPGQGQSHGVNQSHSHGHTPNHNHHQGQGQGHNSNNYQAQLLAQAQAQLQAQALAQAALHAQAHQGHQTHPVPQVPHVHTPGYPTQYVHYSPPQQLPPQPAYLSRGPSGYNSGAATPVSMARLQAQQQQQYGQLNTNNNSMQNMQPMQNMQMVNTPDGMVMMVPVSASMPMPQGMAQTMHSTGYPSFMSPQQAYTPRAYTPTAYAQQQAYLHQGQQGQGQGQGYTTPRGSLQQHHPQQQPYNQHNNQQNQQQHHHQQQQPSQHALQQHATQQQGILKELSCSQYFAQKGIRLSIKTHVVEDSPSVPSVPVPRSHSADNTPREAYLQRKLNSTPRRTQYSNNIYTNYNNTGSNNNLYGERGPVSRRGSNDSVNTTSLYIGDLSIDEAAEYAESPPSSGKGETNEVEALTPTTATSATTVV